MITWKEIICRRCKKKKKNTRRKTKFIQFSPCFGSAATHLSSASLQVPFEPVLNLQFVEQGPEAPPISGACESHRLVEPRSDLLSTFPSSQNSSATAAITWGSLSQLSRASALVLSRSLSGAMSNSAAQRVPLLGHSRNAFDIKMSASFLCRCPHSALIAASHSTGFCGFFFPKVRSALALTSKTLGLLLQGG